METARPKFNLINILILISLVTVILLNFLTAKEENNTIELEPGGRMLQPVTDNNQSYYYEVVGAVSRPGVYSAREPLLVEDAIELAGGMTLEADLDHVYRNIFLAVTVIPGEKIFIPKQGSEEITGERSDKINFNTATKSELDDISGVGEVTAAKIIAGRPYRSCSELQTLSGLSAAVKERLIALCVL